jgi:hypothetical protein
MPGFSGLFFGCPHEGGGSCRPAGAPQRSSRLIRLARACLGLVARTRFRRIAACAKRCPFRRLLSNAGTPQELERDLSVLICGYLGSSLLQCRALRARQGRVGAGHQALFLATVAVLPRKCLPSVGTTSRYRPPLSVNRSRALPSGRLAFLQELSVRGIWGNFWWIWGIPRAVPPTMPPKKCRDVKRPI